MNQRMIENVALSVLIVLTFTGLCLLALILGTLLVRGFPAWDVEFLFSASKNFGVEGGVIFQTVGTLILMAGAVCISLPVALGAALFQTECLKSRWLKDLLRNGMHALNAVPTIVFGLVGYLFFAVMLQAGVSWITGSLILAVMILPTLQVNIQEAIESLPGKYRETGMSLGFSPGQLIRSVILPQSVYGIVTGILLGLARAAGETAAIMFTATTFSGIELPTTWTDPVPTLQTHILVLTQEALNPEAQTNAWGAGLILMSLVLLLTGRRDGLSQPHADGVASMKAEPNVIEWKNASISFNGKPILSELTGVVGTHRVTGILGPSGSGKTTLLRTLSRLNDRTDGFRVQGEVRVRGMDIYGEKDLDVYRLRRTVGMVFQTPCVFPVSVRENVLFGMRRLFPKRKKEFQSLVEETLRRVFLWEEVKDRLHKPALTLSQGQQQRLAIARTLAIDPEVLLMDEPTASLDPHSNAAIENLIASLKKRHTVLLVTHNIPQAKRVCDEVIFLHRGRLHECGKNPDFFEHPQNSETRNYLNREPIQ